MRGRGACTIQQMRLPSSILFLATLCVTTFVLAQDPPPAAPKKGGGGGPPKNLKVLKPEEVRTTMGAMRGSLGVQCTFCHVMGDNASDEKPQKLVARAMMKMMNDANAS